MLTNKYMKRIVMQSYIPIVASVIKTHNESDTWYYRFKMTTYMYFKKKSF